MACVLPRWRAACARPATAGPPLHFDEAAPRTIAEAPPGGCPGRLDPAQGRKTPRAGGPDPYLGSSPSQAPATPSRRRRVALRWRSSRPPDRLPRGWPPPVRVEARLAGSRGPPRGCAPVVAELRRAAPPAPAPRVSRSISGARGAPGGWAEVDAARGVRPGGRPRPSRWAERDAHLLGRWADPEGVAPGGVRAVGARSPWVRLGRALRAGGVFPSRVPGSRGRRGPRRGWPLRLDARVAHGRAAPAGVPRSRPGVSPGRRAPPLRTSVSPRPRVSLTTSHFAPSSQGCLRSGRGPPIEPCGGCADLARRKSTRGAASRGCASGVVRDACALAGGHRARVRPGGSRFRRAGRGDVLLVGVPYAQLATATRCRLRPGAGVPLCGSQGGALSWACSAGVRPGSCRSNDDPVRVLRGVCWETTSRRTATPPRAGAPMPVGNAFRGRLAPLRVRVRLGIGSRLGPTNPAPPAHGCPLVEPGAPIDHGCSSGGCARRLARSEDRGEGPPRARVRPTRDSHVSV